jgi:hypothetical protein
LVRKAVARGVAEGLFGYCSGLALALELGEDGKFKVASEKVRIGTSVAEDEIDLDTGFIMLPAAVPQAVPAVPPGPVPPGPGPGPTPPGPGPVPPGTTPPGPTPPAVQRVVEIVFSADRNALFAAWNAVANLADMAGKVSVTLRAESETGFDRNKLQNGVMEPLREADLIE